MKTKRSMIVVFLFAASFLCLALSTPQNLPFKWQYEAPDARCMWIGMLQGTWQEMGITYGRRAAHDIRANFDTEWENEVIKYNPRNQWHKGRETVEARENFAQQYLRKSYQHLSLLGQETIKFMEGIAQGAGPALDQCTRGKGLTNLDKVEFLNYGGLEFYPKESCNAAWIKGEVTRTGETMACRGGQSNFTQDYDRRQVAYVAIPSDPKAPVFWAQASAGAIALSGSMGLLTDRGVAVLTAGAQSREGFDQAYETVAPGAKDFPLSTYAALFAKDAREAAEIFTVGNAPYRTATGRKTVLRGRGSNVLFVDATSAYCVESNARHYAIRTPGYMNEKGSNYIVIANDQQYKDGSYDENNVFHKEQPMTGYCPQHEKSSTYYRFWTGMWNLNNKYGKIDLEMMLRDIVTAHYAYDKDGKLYDVDAETGAPTVPGTFCAHSGPRTAEFPLGTGGNSATSVYLLKSLEAYWVAGWPCTYKDQNWNYVDLKDYVRLRKLSAGGMNSAQ
jgi:hypothetical protein